MDDELLDLIEYAMKQYRSTTFGRRAGFMEYYSLTDIPPRELAAIARRQGRRSLSVVLTSFDSASYYQTREVKMDERLTMFHSVKGYELTQDDKLSIYQKLIDEGYPLIDSVFDMAARYYVEFGIDSISKEQIRDDVNSSYKGLKKAQNMKLALAKMKNLVK